MSRHYVNNTTHSYLRAAERCGWNKRQAKDMMRAASRYGKSYDNLPPSPLQKFLKIRQVGTRRRIKLYKNHIFVFASTSTKCFTVYPVPEEIINSSNVNVGGKEDNKDDDDLQQTTKK